MARFDQLIVKTKQEREGKYCLFSILYHHYLLVRTRDLKPLPLPRIETSGNTRV